MIVLAKTYTLTMEHRTGRGGAIINLPTFAAAMRSLNHFSQVTDFSIKYEPRKRVF